MRGHVRKRGEPGSWEYIVDVGLAAAQRCEDCNKRLWIERRPKQSCPKCGGALKETEERRRETAIDPGTVEVLKAQAARQLDEQKDWDEAWVETGLVFTLENGAALDPESVSRY